MSRSRSQMKKLAVSMIGRYFILMLICLFPLEALASPVTTPFGAYFLTREELGPGIWHLAISIKAPEPGGPMPTSAMLDAKSLQGRSYRGDKEGSSLSFAVSGGQPFISVTDKDDDGATRKVFDISLFDPDGHLSGIQFEGENYTHIVGLGADFRNTSNSFNLLGQVVMPGGLFGNRLLRYADGTPTQIQVPICYALGPGKMSGAIFINETRPLMWDFSSRPWTVSVAGPLDPQDTFDFFVLTGTDLPELRRKFMEIIGRPPVPPRSIFSPWIVDRTRTRLASFNEYLKDIAPFGLGWELGGVFLPGYSGYKEVAETGLTKIMVEETPYVPATHAEFQELGKRGFLVRKQSENGPVSVVDFRGQSSGLIDYTDPAAATYWHSLGRFDLVKNGAQVFFLNGGEPEIYSSQSWYRGVGEVGVHSQFAWGNSFILKWMDGIWTGLKSRRFMRGLVPRLFFLSRNGLGGMGRLSGGLYTLEPNFFYINAMMALKPREHLNLSGVDYFSTDVSLNFAMFALSSYSQNYEAWLAKNAFLDLPLLMPKEFLAEPWAIQNLKLRAGLEPYYYSLAHQAYQTGEPIMAPLLYHFQEDLTARSSPFETMVGPWLLVATGFGLGEERFSFYLPAGRWYDLNTKDTIVMEKGGLVTRPCKMEGYQVPPLLMKEGAIIPTFLEADPGNKQLLIRAFPGPRFSNFTLFEDNGQDLKYQSGEVLKTVIEMTPLKGPDGGLSFVIKAREKASDSKVPTRSYYLELLGLNSVATARLDGVDYNRVAREEEMNEYPSAWIAPGDGRFYFKTPPLDLTRDHELVIH